MNVRKSSWNMLFLYCDCVRAVCVISYFFIMICLFWRMVWTWILEDGIVDWWEKENFESNRCDNDLVLWWTIWKAKNEFIYNGKALRPYEISSIAQDMLPAAQGPKSSKKKAHIQLVHLKVETKSSPMWTGSSLLALDRPLNSTNGSKNFLKF